MQNPALGLAFTKVASKNSLQTPELGEAFVKVAAWSNYVPQILGGTWGSQGWGDAPTPAAATAPAAATTATDASTQATGGKPQAQQQTPPAAAQPKPKPEGPTWNEALAEQDKNRQAAAPPANAAAQAPTAPKASTYVKGTRGKFIGKNGRPMPFWELPPEQQQAIREQKAWGESADRQTENQRSIEHEGQARSDAARARAEGWNGPRSAKTPPKGAGRMGHANVAGSPASAWEAATRHMDQQARLRGQNGGMSLDEFEAMNWQNNPEAMRASIEKGKNTFERRGIATPTYQWQGKSKTPISWQPTNEEQARRMGVWNQGGQLGIAAGKPGAAFAATAPQQPSAPGLDERAGDTEETLKAQGIDPKGPQGWRYTAVASGRDKQRRADNAATAKRNAEAATQEQMNADNGIAASDAAQMAKVPAAPAATQPTPTPVTAAPTPAATPVKVQSTGAAPRFTPRVEQPGAIKT